jgi:hypothetical protein
LVLCLHGNTLSLLDTILIAKKHFPFKRSLVLIELHLFSNFISVIFVPVLLELYSPQSMLSKAVVLARKESLLFWPAELRELAALTTWLNVCCRRELGVVGGVELLTSPAILNFLLPHKLDWLPMLDILEFLLLENWLPDLPRL